MKLVVYVGEHRFVTNSNSGVSLAKPIDFDSTCADFGVDPPTRQPVSVGNFVGATKQGGSCNVDLLSIIPHCHGTHTETIGHIVDDVNKEFAIANNGPPAWTICALLTTQLRLAEDSSELYTPPSLPGDVLITAASLNDAMLGLGRSHELVFSEVLRQSPEPALVIRCQASVESAVPPYLTGDAISWCNDQGIKHLLVESPSIDRTDDGGLLSNHHLYWNVPPGTHRTNDDSWKDKTITESISIDERLNDGFYLLNLHVPALCTDAAPSNPVLHPLEWLRDSDVGVFAESSS